MGILPHPVWVCPQTDVAVTFFSPVFRSRQNGHRYLTAREVIGIGVITWLAPMALGIALIVVSFAIGGSDPGAFLSGVQVIGSLLLFAPFVGVIAVPFALLIGSWVMRIGWAGSGTAFLTSLFLPGILGGILPVFDPTSAAIGAMLALTPAVVFHAIVLWSATKMLCPLALRRDLP